MLLCCRDQKEGSNVERKKSIKFLKINNLRTRKYYFSKHPDSDNEYRLEHIPSINYQNLYNWIEIKAFRTTFSKIAVLYVKNKNAKSDIHMIVSKCMVTDISSFLPTAMDLSNQLKVNIVSYDYSGQGESKGDTSLNAIAQNLQEVVSFVVQDLVVKKSNIVIFGHSMGTIPSVYYCSMEKSRGIRGLILMSSFSSSTKVFWSRPDDMEVELLKNEHFANISCPVFLIHGCKDEIVPFSEIAKLANHFKKVYTWFPNKGKHDNIFSRYRMNFLIYLKLFLSSLRGEERPSKISYNYKFEEGIGFEQRPNTKNQNCLKIFENLSNISPKQSTFDNQLYRTLSPFGNASKGTEETLMKKENEANLNDSGQILAGEEEKK